MTEKACRLIKVLLSAVVWLSAFGEGRAANTASIIWAVNDSPPFHIFDGPYAGRGVCDQLIDGLRTKLPEFEHELLRLPQARMDKMVKGGQSLCFPCMIKKNDDPHFIYSDVINVRQPHRLILNHEAFLAIKKEYGTEVSLRRLLKDGKYRFGYPLGRKYGKLQPIIEQYSDIGYDTFPLPVEKSLLELVSMERLDYGIDYAMVATYFERVEGIALYLLSIEENASQPVSGAIGCTNSPWGEQVIKAFNTVLPELLEDSPYRDHLHFWFQDSLLYPSPTPSTSQ